MQDQQDILAQFDVTFPSVDPRTLNNTTIREIFLGESLKTPGLQTSIILHSYMHDIPSKNLDELKGAEMSIKIKREVLARYGLPSTMEIAQTTYRLDNRKLYNQNTEEYILHGCDQSILNDAATLVSKMWKCTTPSTVVKDVLINCVGVPGNRLNVESADPKRDYIAENIHPFQVVNQQSNVALADGNDPSFIHYMTYENFGTHHFRSLKKLSTQPAIMEFTFNEVGAASGYGNPYSIITHSFPCDFDLLSDVLNGIDSNGKLISTTGLFNPVTKQFNTFGNQNMGCGIGGGVHSVAITNQDSAKKQNACPDYAHLYVQKRQARMGLLEPDKVALRITVPWNPSLHAGEVIRLSLPNKSGAERGILNYGSGDYLISAMTHKLKRGGYATTVLDCVSVTAGRRGEV